MLGGAIVLIGSGRALAQEQCFCLAHPQSGQIYRYRCVDHAMPNSESRRTICMNPADRSDQLVADAGKFLRVDAGKARCNPCAPSPGPTIKDVPRNLQSKK
jgi:hypothetical protein